MKNHLTFFGLNVPETSEPEVSEPSSSLYELDATTPCDLFHPAHSHQYWSLPQSRVWFCYFPYHATLS